MPFDPRLAWWALEEEERRELDAARDRGMFGGDGKPRYWWLQETATYPAPAGRHNEGKAHFIESGKNYALVYLPRVAEAIKRL